MQKHYAEMNQRMDSRAAQADRETKISPTPNSNGKRERTDDSAPEKICNCEDSDIVNTSWCNCLTRDSESLGMICSSQKGRGLICDKCAAADSSDTVVQQAATVVQQPATVVQQPATAVEYTQFHNPILMMMKTKLKGTKIDTSLL